MTTDPPGGSSDPYASQTQTNTGSQEWLAGYQTIKADFGSLTGYAMNMLNAAMDLQPASMPLYKIPELTNQAFRNSTPLPEAQLAALFVSTNFKDLISMLTDLHVGLQNMAFAAQTISDAYHLRDDGSAHDLNSLITVDGVDFAFGMGGVRPGGLDQKIGKTWLETQGATVNEAQSNAAAVSNASDPSAMGGVVAVSYAGPPDHQVKITTISYPDGSQIQIEQTVGYDGTTWTTTSVIGSDGKTQASSRQVTTVSGGATTVVTQTADKTGIYQDTSKQTTTTTVAADGAKVTTTTSSTKDGAKWTPSGTQTKTVNTDGSTQTTTSTITYGPDGTPTTKTSTVAIGSNDGDVSDQKAYDPKATADHQYTTFTHVAPR